MTRPTIIDLEADASGTYQPKPDSLPPGAGCPDTFDNPSLYRDVLIRRIFAYCIDLAIVGFIWGVFALFALIVGIMSFGLLWFVAAIPALVVPCAYNAFTIGGPSAATVGMRLMGLRVWSQDGQAPNLVQALIQVALFYLFVPASSGLILLVALFNSRRRHLHDLLSGLVVVQTNPAPQMQGPGPGAP